MKKSKLLLGLGTMTIAAMPLLSVVSCSDSKGSNEKGNNLFPGLSENEKKWVWK